MDEPTRNDLIDNYIFVNRLMGEFSIILHEIKTRGENIDLLKKEVIAGQMYFIRFPKKLEQLIDSLLSYILFGKIDFNVIIGLVKQNDIDMQNFANQMDKSIAGKELVEKRENKPENVNIREQKEKIYLQVSILLKKNAKQEKPKPANEILLKFYKKDEEANRHWRKYESFNKAFYRWEKGTPKRSTLSYEYEQEFAPVANTIDAWLKAEDKDSCK